MSNTMLEEDFEKVQACYDNYRDSLLQLEKSLEKAKPLSIREDDAYLLLCGMIDRQEEADSKDLYNIGKFLGK